MGVLASNIINPLALIHHSALGRYIKKTSLLNADISHSKRPHFGRMRYVGFFVESAIGYYFSYVLY